MADLFEEQLFLVVYINAAPKSSEAYLYNTFYSLPAAQRFFDDLAIKLKKDFAGSIFAGSEGELQLTLATVSIEEFDKLDIGSQIHKPQSREVFNALCKFKHLTIIKTKELNK